MFLGLVNKQCHVFFVETAYDECGSVSHGLTELAHVVKQDIAIDVGQHNIEHAAHMV